MMAPDIVGDEEFRQALGLFASGVTVITTLDESGAAHGMTATAFCSLSMRPPMILVAIGRETRCHRQILARGRFGVSVLHEDQAGLSRHFGGRPTAGPKPKFAVLDGIPVLAEAIVTLACTLDSPMAGGDHSIFTGLVNATSTAPGSPLIHFAGRYRGLTETDAMD